MKVLDYKVERTKNCIKVDIDNWLKVDSNIVQRFTLSGKTPLNYITEVLDTNLEDNFEGAVAKGDFVLLTRVVSEVAQYKSYKLDDDKRYYNVPVMQVIGKFKNNNLTFNNLEPLFDKLIFEKVEHNMGTILETPDQSTTIGKVLKVGTCRFDKKWNKTPMTVKEGDTVLIRDNVTTEFSVDGKTYYATEESMVVGVFKDTDNLTLDKMTFINSNILMKKYKPDMILNSNILVMPDINFDELDEVSLDNQDQFEVLYLDERLEKLNKHDIIFINKDVTSYVYFNGERYNIISEMTFVEGKIRKGK